MSISGTATQRNTLTLLIAHQPLREHGVHTCSEHRGVRISGRRGVRISGQRGVRISTVAPW